MKQHYRLPFDLTIPTPIPSVIQHGIHATTTFGKHPKFRCNKAQLEKIDTAARICGMKRADFMRFCCVHVAQEILKITQQDD